MLGHGWVQASLPFHHSTDTGQPPRAMETQTGLTNAAKGGEQGLAEGGSTWRAGGSVDGLARGQVGGWGGKVLGGQTAVGVSGWLRRQEAGQEGCIMDGQTHG